MQQYSSPATNAAPQVSSQMILPTFNELLPLEKQQNWPAVVERCERYLANRPVAMAWSDFPWLDHLTNAYFNLENYEQALVSIDKMLLIHPDDHSKIFFRATALKNIGQFAAAIELLEWLASCKDYPSKSLCQLFTNLALNYHAVGLYEKSLEAVKLAREFFKKYGGDEDDLKKREAFCYLHNGNYAKGFELYEYRHHNADGHAKHFSAMAHHVPEKIWRGEDLKDKTLLITMEQGLGDMVMMARFLPLMAGRAKKIIVECYKELYRLFAQTKIEGIELVLFTSEEKKFDAWTKVMSLPYHLNINDNNLPNKLPYLSPTTEGKVEFGPSDKKYKIGLVWQSGVKGVDKANRSMTINDIAPLLAMADCQFFSLQYDADPNKIKNEIANAGFADKIVDTAPMITDLSDTALLMQKMDLIITVDTVIAHLAGALQLPSWVILPFETSWKWHRDEKTIWYPEVMTLFRQTTAGSWQQPVEQVAFYLQKILAKPKAEREDFVHVEKMFPKKETTPQLPNIDMMEKCKATMDAKNYWVAAIYMNKLLRDKTIATETKQMLLLNQRNAWRAFYQYERAMKSNQQLLASKNLPLAKLVEVELSQCQMLQNTEKVKDAMLHLQSAQKKIASNAAIKKQHDMAWQKQAMFGYLRLQDYKTAWQHYESRHAGIVSYQALKYLPHHLAEKKLQKGEDMRDKTILLAMEQGYGDIIQFSRFVPEFAKRCKAVVIEAYDPLYRLFKETLEKDNIKIVLWEKETPTFDKWMLICSMPYMLDIDEKTLQREHGNPYLHLPEQFKKQMPSKNKKIAINWVSSVIGKEYKTRSMTLSDLLPLLDKKGFDFFSLQMDGGKTIKELGLQGIVLDLAPTIKSFFDTASWLTAMDMVISIDSAPVHLAGALGINTKLLLNKHCDWRWSGSGKTSLWYEKNLTIHRQPQQGDWAGAVKSLLTDI